MYESEKGWLERIADKIPGLKGYREKESRRDTDKRLREHLASLVDQARRTLEGQKRELMAKGRLDILDDADRVARKMQKCGDQLRFATYGYSGFFDQVKVREEELDKIYRYDESLLGGVQALDGQGSGVLASPDPAKALSELEAAVEALDRRIEGRKQIFQTPE